MDSLISVRPALLGDAPRMAAVNVESWRETYRGIMPDEVLDDPDLLSRRERFWRVALTDERYRDNRAAVAVHGGEVIGIAMAGPPLDDDASWPSQLYLLYVLSAFHGRGAGGALLDAVIEPTQAAALWVADPNPRAQAFYRKSGFRLDGRTAVEEGIRAVRMVRCTPLCTGTQATPHRGPQQDHR